VANGLPRVAFSRQGATTLHSVVAVAFKVSFRVDDVDDEPRGAAGRRGAPART
jgi:hypothetical protein